MNDRVQDKAVCATITENTQTAIRRVLDGHGGGLTALTPFMGPAIVVSVAYMDPGNFATNIQAGARYGYTLLWVVLVASGIAMLFQALSAKLGIVTGSNLAELCRQHFSKPIVLSMWAVSEVAAMATDLAEFLGGAIGLSLLFHMPILIAMLITAIITYGLLWFEKAGFRPLELIIGALVSIIGLCYLAELFLVPVQWTVLAGALISPRLPDLQAVTIAVGIVGATVMPHALFLHSSLTQYRGVACTEAERAKLVRFSNIEVIVALTLAALVNLAMVVMAAGAFHDGHADVAEIQTAYHTLTPLLGIAAAGIFLLSLIASGISSSVVGTMAGQIIMQGFVGFRIPVWLRRTITMLPSFLVIGSGMGVTDALVASQVILSFALPVPMIALVWFTCQRRVMGRHRNHPVVGLLAVVAAIAVLLLNVVLLLQTFGVPLPRLFFSLSI